MNSRPRLLPWLRLLPLAVLAFAASAVAQSLPGSAPVLTVKPALLLSMPTEDGVVYQVQSSPDLASWSDLGSPVFGTGMPLEQAVAGTGGGFFRLKTVTRPAMGTAPWQLAGLSLQLSDSSRTGRYQFSAAAATAAQGTWQTGNTTRSFTWTWKRAGMGEGAAELIYTDGSREVIDLEFNAALAGCFSRRTYCGGHLDSTSNGSFGPVPANTTGAWAPLNPAGRSIVFGDLPGGSSLSFSSASAGTRVLESAAKPFAGTWLVTGTTTARLIVTFTPSHGEDYTFTFTSAGTGQFVRRIYTEGTFRDEDDGTFCLSTPAS